jgi:hypothetical protein
VRVTRIDDGPTKAVVAKRGTVTTTTIELTIAAGELQEPGQLELTVVNPDDAGGPSNPIRVDVKDIEPTAAQPSTSEPTTGKERGSRRGFLGKGRDGAT